MNAATIQMLYAVKKQGRTWGIYDAAGKLVEGGFFSREAAERSCEEWNAR